MRNDIWTKGLVFGIIVLVITSGILTIAPVMQADLTDGLIGYWSFNSGTANDESGNGHHGTVYGATVVEGKSGNAFSFDGDNDYIDLGDDPDFDITENITIALWFKTDTSQLGTFVSKLDPQNPDNGYNLVMGDIVNTYPPTSAGTIYFMTAKDSTGLAQYDISQTTATYTDNVWHLLTAIYTPDGVSRPKIYIDAVEQSITNYGTPLASIGASPGYNLKFAEYSYGSGYHNFNGTLDEIRIYNRALSEDEIQELFTPSMVYVNDDFDSSTPGWEYNHFDVIQDGINAVAEHGTVYVYNGTYFENIVINKPINLTGNKFGVIIDGNNNGDVLKINSDWVLLCNFTARNGGPDILDGAGIRLTNVSHAKITNVYCLFNQKGIIIYNSTYNRVSNTIFTGNEDYGIIARDGSHNNQLFNNKCIGGMYGIGLIWDNGNNTLLNNTVSQCLVDGLEILHSSYNEVRDCNFSDNWGDISIAYYSNYNFIHANQLLSSFYTFFNLRLGTCANNIISNNTFSGGQYGIWLSTSNSNYIINNTAELCSIGIQIESSSYDSLMYHNKFINNTQNAYDDGTNMWYNSTLQEGNYWSDYIGVDADGDGIGDTPHDIPGGSNQDLYPLGYFHNIPPVANFTYNPTSPTDMDVIQFTDASTEYDGSIVSWSWSFGDGGTSTIQNPTHDYADDGTFIVTLTVTDDNGASNSTSKDVIVSNVAPVANADGPYTSELGQTIIFDGSGSYDPDGDIVSYQWTFGDGGTATGVNPTHKYSNYGTYSVTLTVTDDDGSTDTDSTSVYINRVNPPTVILQNPIGGETLKSTITVKWWALDTEDGYNLPISIYFKDETSIVWTAFKNNPYSNTGSCEWDTTTLPDGTYKLSVQAQDSDGNIVADSSDWFQIKNHEEPPINNPPRKPDTPQGPANGKIDIDYIYVSMTHDPEGDMVYYLWDWGDGNNSGWIGPSTSGVTSQATHNWTIKGNYAIKVKAKDIYGHESVWSDPLPITMPYSYNPIHQFFEWLFQRFPNAFPILRHLLNYQV